MTANAAATRPVVLFFCPVPDFYGGAEEVLLQMMENPAISPHLVVPADGEVAAAARERGIPYDLVDLRKAGDVHRPVRARAVAAASVDTVAAARAIRTIARRVGCRFVHSNGLKPHVVGAVARRMGPTPWRLIAHFHDIPRPGLERAIWRFVVAGADGVVAVSRPCLPDPDRSHVHIVPNGLTLPIVPLREHTPALPLRLGFVGRYSPVKGLHMLLDWFVAAREAGLEAALRLRGRANPIDADYWAKIQRRIAASAYAPSIVDEGFQPRDQLYAGLDVVVVPSEVPDPHPFVVKEAQAAGVPVIAFPSGGIPDMIEPGRTGFLVDTPAAFVDVLQRLIHEPGLYAAIRRAAWQHAEKAFQMANFYARLNAVYRADAGARSGE
jgi:glycosyltransferase involved in cell wall biosynthesis